LGKHFGGPGIFYKQESGNPVQTKGTSAYIFIPYERLINPSFTTERMVGGGRPLVPEIWG